MRKNVTLEEARNDPDIIVPIVYDEIFREIFGNPKNVVFTEYLVSALLNIPYEEIKGKISYKTRTSENVNINKNKIEKDIVFIVDIENKSILNLEMNLKDLTSTKILRNVKYITDIFSNIDKNIKVKSVIQFNFNTSFVDNKNKFIYDKYLFRNKKGNILTEKIQIIEINVAKMSELWYSNEYKKYKNVSKKVFWFATLLMENEISKLNELIKDTPISKDIATNLRKRVMDMNDNNELYLGRWYDPEEEYKYWKEVEKETIREEALNEGISQNQEEIVKNMYEQDVDINTIHKYTGIPIKTITKIINNKTKKK